MIKYSKILGEVKVLEDNGTISTVQVIKTGEIKKLMNKMANLSDVPFVTEKKKAIKVDLSKLTKEDQDHIDYLNATGQGLASILKESKENYRNNLSGKASIR